MVAMLANVSLLSSLTFVVRTVGRYWLSLGHGALTLALGAAIFWTGDWSYEYIVWGLVSGQACLIGFWIALADRSWPSRMVYGGLHVIGLMFCVLVAAKMLDERGTAYSSIDVLRDVPAMLVSTLVAGLLLRRWGWRLLTGAKDERTDIAPGVRRMQMPLGEFIKWFTLLCIVLGLSVSLLPPASFLLDDWIWRSRMSYYPEFLVAICLPTGFLASLILLLTLSDPALKLRQIIWMGCVACGATLLWVGIVLIGLNLMYNAYYFSQAPVSRGSQIPTFFVSLQTICYGFPGRNCWSSLACLLAVVIFVAVTVRLAGWRIRRVAAKQAAA